MRQIRMRCGREATGGSHAKAIDVARETQRGAVCRVATDLVVIRIHQLDFDAWQGPSYGAVCRLVHLALRHGGSRILRHAVALEDRAVEDSLRARSRGSVHSSESRPARPRHHQPPPPLTIKPRKPSSETLTSNYDQAMLPWSALRAHSSTTRLGISKVMCLA